MRNRKFWTGVYTAILCSFIVDFIQAGGELTVTMFLIGFAIIMPILYGGAYIARTLEDK